MRSARLFLACCAVSLGFAQSQPGLLYVGAWQKQVLVIDEAQQKVVDKIPLTTGTPADLQISSDRKKLFVWTWDHDGIEVIDLVTRRVTNHFVLDQGNRRVLPLGLAADPQDRLLYTTTDVMVKQIDRFEREPTRFAVIDLAQQKITRSVDYPKEEENLSVLGAGHRVSPDGKYLYEFRDNVLIFDTSDFKLVDKIELANPRHPGMEMVRMQSTNYPVDDPGIMTAVFNASDPIVHRQVFGIARVDLNTRNFDFTPVGPAPKAMMGLRVTPDGKTGYTIVQDDGPPGNRRSEFWVFDMSTRKLIKKAEFPGRSTFNFTISSGGKQIYIWSGPSLEVYDASTLQLQKIIDVEADMTTDIVAVPPRKS
jgi:hypothetical protein